MKRTLLYGVLLVPTLIISLPNYGKEGLFRVGGGLRHGYARPPLWINVGPLDATSNYGPYSPAQVRHAYGVDLLAAGTTGAGQKIGIVDAYGDPGIQTDLDDFCNYYGIPSTTVQIVYPQGPPTTSDSNWALETALDVEWAHAIAPGATIIVSVAASASFNDLLGAVDAAVSAGANVISMSWGGQEFAGVNAYDSHFQAPGVTYVASSGDSGELAAPFEVEWPASSPYVVSVGGTTLYLDGNGNRIVPSGQPSSETAWSGSGGGLSSVYGTPAYQNGWQTFGVRCVPDVSYLADPNTGVGVAYGPFLYEVGGTSVGSPQWAGLVALANQSRSSGVNGDTDVYSVAGTAPTLNSARIFDITSGNNGSDTDDMAGTGYDLVTGLGSPVANGLVPALAGSAPPAPDFSISVTPNSQAVAPGGGTTYTVTITALNGFSGTVGLSVSGLPAGASANFNPGSVSGSGSSTMSVTTSASTPVGSYPLTITGASGTSLKHSVSATLVVGNPDFAISASPSSRSVRHGRSTSYTVTITPSGGFAGTVNLRVTGLLSGASASFSPSSITGSGSSTLTIHASYSATRGTTTLTITGQSSNPALTHTTTVSLTVY